MRKVSPEKRPGQHFVFFTLLAFSIDMPDFLISELFYELLAECIGMGDAAGEIKEWITHFRYGWVDSDVNSLLEDVWLIVLLILYSD